MPKRHFAQAKVTQRKQIAVPKKVREKLGEVEEGDFILFYEDGKRIYIEKGRIGPVP
jgi:AbrB family looped-hinge helix DNA binding protein